MDLHVFSCRNNSKMFAFTRVRDGSNLPTDRCTGGWVYEKTTNYERGNSYIGILDIDSILDFIEKDGFAIQNSTLKFDD